jgi:hypothetical protein
MSSNHLLVIKSVLAASASWRERLTKTYQDQRNATAKNLLEQLAAQSVPEEVLAALDGYSESEIAREASTTAKLIGFKIHTASLSSFVREIVNRIEASRAEWQSAFRNDGGAK